MVGSDAAIWPAISVAWISGHRKVNMGSFHQKPPELGATIYHRFLLDASPADALDEEGDLTLIDGRVCNNASHHDIMERD